MDNNLFEKIDPLVDGISDRISELIEGEALNTLKQKLADLSRELSEYSVMLEMNVQVFDPENGQNLPLLQTGLATSDGAAPYQS